MTTEEIKKEKTFAPYDRVIKFILPIIPQKLLPNHLTFIRLIFSPVLIFWLMAEEYLVSIIIFVILALTDMLDGALARLRNQITDWGKIWDPIADKLLVGCVVVVLLLKINLPLTIFLLAFELAFVLGGAFQKLKVKDIRLQADAWGKIKMNLQCFGAGFLMLGFFSGTVMMVYFAQGLFFLSLFFAGISLYKKGI